MNKQIRITHPMATHISVQDSDKHYCTPQKSSELAFFMNKKWVVEIIPEFAEFADVEAGDTRVYAYVPNELVNEFIDRWGE